MKQIYMVIIVSLVFAAPLSAQENFSLKYISEGETPLMTSDNYNNNISITTKNLRNSDEVCIAYTNVNQLQVYRFDEGKFELIFEDQNDFERRRNGQRNPDVTACDIDNDGLDELIYGVEKTVFIYNWDGSGFKVRSFEFPYYIYMLTAGDFTNDGEIEIVTACLETITYPPGKGSEGGPTEPFILVISKIRENNLETIFASKDKTVIMFNRIQPPGTFECIMDYYNTGINQLITTLPQSDVSSTRYKTSFWDNKINDVILSDRFNIPGFAYSGGYRPSIIIGNIIPVILGDKSFFLAKSMGNEKGPYQPELHLMKNENGRYLNWKLLDLSGAEILITRQNDETGVLLLNQKRGRRPINYLYQYYILEQNK
ncbi:FG-GAP-like repeat-containing protein [candidate division KSB1 bacterium]